MNRILLTTLALLLLALPAQAQDEPEITRTVQAGFSYGKFEEMADSLDTSWGESVALMFSRPFVWDWRIDFGHAHKFDSDGTAFGTAYTRHFTSGLSASVGFGTGAIGIGDAKEQVILPKYRFDAGVGYGFLPERQLLAHLGYTHTESEGANSSDGLTLSANWYMNRWIVGGHYGHTVGQPGDTVSHSGGVSLTWSLWRKFDVGGGLSWGEVAYELEATPTNALVEYSSNGYFLGISHWLGEDWGYNLRLDRERTSFYRFNGFTLNVFKEW